MNRSYPPITLILPSTLMFFLSVKQRRRDEIIAAALLT
jgi:hypothetical protein